jgi:hypothetical protein
MCVLKNLFKCEKKCDSVKARKALLKDFTSKVYNAEVVFTDNDGKTTDEQYAITIRLSENQKDETLMQVHGNAIIQKEADTPIKCSWSGIYLAKKRGYKMRLIGDNIEKDFYVDCDGNETINFLIKKTASEGVRGSEMHQHQSGTGTLSESNNQGYEKCMNICMDGCDSDECYNTCPSLCPSTLPSGYSVNNNN